MSWYTKFGIICILILLALAAQGCAVEEPEKFLTPEEISAIHEKCKKLKLGTAYVRNYRGLTHVFCVPE